MLITVAVLTVPICFVYAVYKAKGRTFVEVSLVFVLYKEIC